jgi:DNA-binding NarL/FixJ family response regulator
MAGNPKIIIVDDHTLFREGMKLLIEKEGIGEVIAEAENGREFLDILEKQELDPDLVLMDIEMPVMNGIEATTKAKAMRPDLKILALTMLSEKENYSGMIHSGALGFVLKTSGKQQLEKAIQTVIGGECYFSNEILRQIIVNSRKEQSSSGKSEATDVDLTDREFEVLEYFCKGFSAAETADKLFRSVKTVEAHRTKLLEKTNTKNTINLVLYAIKNKLVEIE